MYRVGKHEVSSPADITIVNIQPEEPMSAESPATYIRMTQIQFAHLFGCVQTNRDGISQQNGWKGAHQFLLKKLREQGHAFPVSQKSVEDACKAAGVTPKRMAREPGDSTKTADKIDILVRAVCRLYDKLGEPQTEGLKRLKQIADDSSHPNKE